MKFECGSKLVYTNIGEKAQFLEEVLVFLVFFAFICGLYLLTMGPSQCAVVKCFNNKRKLDKWNKTECDVHPDTTKHNCSCPPPFRLFCFPGPKLYHDRRQRWTILMRRINANNTTWVPKPSDRVCSTHFVDSEPTPAHPDPSLHLGYDLTQPQQRRQLVRHHFPKKRLFSEQDEGVFPHIFSTPPATQQPQSSPVSSFLSSDHSYCLPSNKKECLACKDKSNVIHSLSRKISNLSLEVNSLKRNKFLSRDSKSVFTWRKIKSDEKMNFYTGITTVAAFHDIFSLIEPNLPKVKYWRGTKRSIVSSKVCKSIKPKKLPSQDEFLLTLMKLRLGLLNEDLADRFGISPTTCSNTFKTWIRMLRILLGDSLVNWLPIEAIRDHLPEMYSKAGHHNLRCIIDCTEIYIERPKSLDLQAQTWSDYKSHNTIKFLIGISPTGYITYLSDCYTGRSSDKYICSDSGFYNLLERGDEIMADRGFQIKEDLLLRYCNLSVPPGARVKAQMTTSECKRTKGIANLRIHVERAINRIKTFRIFKSVLPITMLHHADDIVRTCAALCNLKPPLICASKKRKDAKK